MRIQELSLPHRKRQGRPLVGGEKQKTFEHFVKDPKTFHQAQYNEHVKIDADVNAYYESLKKDFEEISGRVRKMGRTKMTQKAFDAECKIVRTQMKAVHKKHRTSVSRRIASSNASAN
ncbi:hypothetical protein L596_029065 [Steinernema carpocapsae]|uniref:Uncharacterized protein n=1 Tax=Steinernema carpocapsae TaxID=34508 RepID=A0A4U5LTI4_STECR|nr:hypothetical protein L596_029065 [Steinernema carpocapsae]